MRLDDILPDLRERAGFIPYFFEDGVPKFLFMTSSSAIHGSLLPSIAKGRVDDKETARQAGLREAEEELGLRKKNLINDTIKPVFVGTMRGRYESYNFTVFMGEVKDKDDFGPHDSEVGSTHWLSVKEYAKHGLATHLPIVRKAAKLLASNNTAQ